MLASFFYRTKQYGKALSMMSYSLSKCTLKKFCFGVDFSDPTVKFMNIRAIRKKGVINSMKLLSLQPIPFIYYCTLIPSELHMEVNNRPYTIPLVVFAHFVRVLCHYHRNNMRQCRESVTDLQLTIAEEYCIPGYQPLPLAVSYNCLGVALQLIGETDYAKQAFVASTKLFPSPFVNTVFQRLASLNPI
ncbi:unnamed protein product [Mytilus coruscus]|uniref:Uncharacterized protein n=1 Tax=Mytilus coruscus TaxID=42192 RepID=A0A6J8A612_MYTCO|nr:unnamed protein product [Mytilus coruscus]